MLLRFGWSVKQEELEKAAASAAGRPESGAASLSTVGITWRDIFLLTQDYI
jgi:hypothetical protein